MATKPEFDLDAAHRYFSADCFNKAWDLIDKPNRTPEENEEMIRLSVTSIWHWTERKDHTKTNLSVGFWQLSRIYALLGQVDDARQYGQKSLNLVQDDEGLPFYRAYANEALARAELVAGNHSKKEAYLKEAQRLAAGIADPEDRKQLLDDLGTIASGQ